MDSAENKLKGLASKESSPWIEKAEWRVANEAWLDKSAKIALTILRTIRERKISQKDLAEKLSISPQQVSKILKGSENLTLETISKIEVVLGITLVDIPSFSFKMSPAYDIEYVAFASYEKAEPAIYNLSYIELQKSVLCTSESDDDNKKAA